MLFFWTDGMVHGHTSLLWSGWDYKVMERFTLRNSHPKEKRSGYSLERRWLGHCMAFGDTRGFCWFVLLGLLSSRLQLHSHMSSETAPRWMKCIHTAQLSKIWAVWECRDKMQPHCCHRFLLVYLDPDILFLAGEIDILYVQVPKSIGFSFK